MNRVFIVEDDPWIRRGLEKHLASAQRGLSVVRSAGSVADALEALKAGVECEAALVDLGLPDGDGCTVIRHLRRTRPGVAVVAFTVAHDPTSIFQALKAGACGYLLKDTPPDRLRGALLDALDGGAPMSPSVARQVVGSFERDGSVREELSVRETDVLTHMVRGLSYVEAAQALGITVSTVQTHIKNIYRKLEVNTKAEAAVVAISKGLVRP